MTVEVQFGPLLLKSLQENTDFVLTEENVRVWIECGRLVVSMKRTSEGVFIEVHQTGDELETMREMVVGYDEVEDEDAAAS